MGVNWEFSASLYLLPLVLSLNVLSLPSHLKISGSNLKGLTKSDKHTNGSNWNDFWHALHKYSMSTILNVLGGDYNQPVQCQVLYIKWNYFLLLLRKKCCC